MNKEDLKKLGVEDEELAQKILVEHGKGIEKLKSDLAAKQQELDGAKTQLTEANKQIEAFKELKPEELKKAADDWKLKFEQSQSEAAAQVDRLKFDHALDSALAGAKSRNVKAVKSLLNTELLKLAEDGSISGLKEQLETLKSDNDYLFESDEPNPTIVTGSNNNQTNSDPVILAARKAAGLDTTP
jgi:hypothetical protein